MKPPIPQVPPPNWKEFGDLQEWGRYRQERAADDKHSNALTDIAETVHQFPGGWIVTASVEKVLNWARKS